MTSRPKSKIPNERMRLPHKSVASVLVLAATLAGHSSSLHRSNEPNRSRGAKNLSFLGVLPPPQDHL